MQGGIKTPLNKRPITLI